MAEEKYISHFIDFKGKKFDIRAGRINGHSIEASVPADAVFTDTTYDNIINHIESGEQGSYTIPIPLENSKLVFFNANGEWQPLTLPDHEGVIEIRKTVKDYQISNSYSVIFGKQTDDRSLKDYSIATGKGTNTKEHQLVIGFYNQLDSNALFTIGNGTSSSNRQNSFNILKNGDMRIKVNNNDLLKVAMDALGWQGDY